jgi:hypothetical protein
VAIITPDTLPDVPSLYDDEFDREGSTGKITPWTALGTPTSHDINKTAPGHYFVTKSTAAGDNLVGIYKPIPPMPFTVTAKLSDCSIRDNFQGVFLFVGEATPGKMRLIGVTHNTNAVITKQNYTAPTTFSASTLLTDFQAGSVPWYFRIVVVSSTSVAYWFSAGGRSWRLAAAAENPAFTVGSVGLCGQSNSATNGFDAYFDWIRFTTP